MIYKKPSELIGWDFSRLTVTTEGPETHYEELVKSHLRKDMSILDIGTGGGEKLSLFAPFVKRAVGIDADAGMVAAAQRNALSNMSVVQASSEHLPFNEEFDLVISRHAPCTASEIYRVLKKGGVFITQQVSEHDKQNWKELFGRGQSFGVLNDTLKHRYLEELRAAGFTIVEEKTVDTKEYYATMDDVIFLLGNTPIIPDFDVVKDEGVLKQIESQCTSKGLRTNSMRFLIVVRK